LDAILHFFIFMLIFWLTRLVRKSAMLLEQKSKELVRSNEELEQFAFKAAHDLQSPLTTILGYSELLNEESMGRSLTQNEKELGLSAIAKGATRMSLMIKALLDYAKVTKEEKKVPPVDLAQVVREVIENLHATITEKKAEVVSDSLPTVAINPGLAGILFQNLIGNALKYCENAPRVHVSAVRKGRKWIFSVRDNGIGIPEESLERVFIMFEKLATQREYPGSGIGLATCQKIVARYGGRIWVESKPGEGSTFFFTLPAA
jgi:light-regulated signal transduction histidine kinase (bacteriophytochrome)